MKRRLFLSYSVVAMSAIAGASVACSFEAPILLIGHEQPGYFEVNGKPEDCRKFVEAFQTHLWPEWKTHSNDSARRIISKCFAEWPRGVGRVSKQGMQCQEALKKTLDEFKYHVSVTEYRM